jgi:hypothetical protein
MNQYEPSTKHGQKKLKNAACFGYFSTLKMEVVAFLQNVHFYRTIRRHIPEDSTLQYDVSFGRERETYVDNIKTDLNEMGYLFIHFSPTSVPRLRKRRATAPLTQIF